MSSPTHKSAEMSEEPNDWTVVAGKKQRAKVSNAPKVAKGFSQKLERRSNENLDGALRDKKCESVPTPTRKSTETSGEPAGWKKDTPKEHHVSKAPERYSQKQKNSPSEKLEGAWGGQQESVPTPTRKSTETSGEPAGWKKDTPKEHHVSKAPDRYSQKQKNSPSEKLESMSSPTHESSEMREKSPDCTLVPEKKRRDFVAPKRFRQRAPRENLVEAELRNEWKSEQLSLKEKLETEDSSDVRRMLEAISSKDRREKFYIGGVDISFIKDNKVDACAALVIISFPDLKVVYHQLKMIKLTAPYIPGFLAFREADPLVELYNTMLEKDPQYKPHVIFVDGNGRLHPRGFGLACHLGVLLDVPCVGVAKTLMHVNGIEDNAAHRAKKRQLRFEGDRFPLITCSDETLGVALRSTSRSINPIYVSQGHKISLQSAVDLVLLCTKYRIPEPTRLADLYSRRHLSELAPGPQGRTILRDIRNSCPVNGRSRTTLPPVNGRSRTTLPPVNGRSRTTLPPVNGRSRTTLPPVNGRSWGNQYPAYGRSWRNHYPVNGRSWENHYPVNGRSWENQYPANGRSWENQYPAYGRSWENQYPANGRSWENQYPANGRSWRNHYPVNGRNRTLVNGKSGENFPKLNGRSGGDVFQGMAVKDLDCVMENIPQ